MRDMYKHVILAVREADVHIRTDKVGHRLQLTVRSQNPSTFVYAKGGFACIGQSRTKGALVLIHAERGNKGKGLRPSEAKSQDGVCFPLSTQCGEQAKWDFVCPE